MENRNIPYKIYLDEADMPQAWYNLRADMKNKPAPLLNPGTGYFDMTSIKSAATGTAPVQGGGTSYEERMNNSICLIDLLSDNLRFAESEVRLTKKALATLTDEERRILEVLYIDRQKRGAERLCQELAIAEEATVWKRAMRALENYCAARYSSAAI